MKDLATLGISILLTIVGFGQNFGEIHGKVVDEFGDGLPGANVSASTLSGEVLATTDVNGKYKIKPLIPGIYNLTVSFIGYHDQPVEGVNVDPDKIKFLKEIKLTPNSAQIPEVFVDGYLDKLIDPEETSRITMRTADIKTNANRTNTMTMISTMKSDIKQGTNGELYFRGSRTGAVQYNIDGVKITGNTIRVPSAAIGSISVYTGGLPAKYGDTTGGVVVIETRSYMDLYNESLYSTN